MKRRVFLNSICFCGSRNGQFKFYRCRTGAGAHWFYELRLYPNLTYIRTYADMAEREKNWATFLTDSEWKKMNSIPEYATAVSNISNTFLRPTGYSQI